MSQNSQTLSSHLQKMVFKMELRGYARHTKDHYLGHLRLLAQTLLETLPTYRPTDLLFPGPIEGQPMSTKTPQTVFQVARKKAGITKPVTIHTLDAYGELSISDTHLEPISWKIILTCAQFKFLWGIAILQRPQFISTYQKNIFAQ